MVNTASLLKQDFYLLLEQTAAVLKAGTFEQLDVENLVEEIESMGRSEKKSVESNLEVILIHLLKYQYQPDKRSNNWRYNLLKHRRRLADLFQDSPSLKPYFLETLTYCFQGVRKLASVETELAIAIFPLECPFTAEQIVDEDFLLQ